LRFTVLFEALVIDWLKEPPAAAVARRVRMTWDEVTGIMDPAVARGLARRTVELPKALAVDETSFQKRHEYVTIVHDPRGPRSVCCMWRTVAEKMPPQGLPERLLGRGPCARQGGRHGHARATLSQYTAARSPLVVLVPTPEALVDPPRASTTRS
jgi:hypothetical protein